MFFLKANEGATRGGDVQFFPFSHSQSLMKEKKKNFGEEIEIAWEGETFSQEIKREVPDFVEEKRKQERTAEQRGNRKK